MFYRYCVQEEYILEKQNPTAKVKWVKEPKIIINTFTEHIVKIENNTYGIEIILIAS